MPNCLKIVTAKANWELAQSVEEGNRVEREFSS